MSRVGKAAAAAFFILVFAGIIANLTDQTDPDNAPAAASNKTPTMIPVPTATLTSAERDRLYPPLADVRELVVRPGESFGESTQFTGEISTIQVAPPKRIYKAGNQKEREFKTVIYVQVESPVGSLETVLVGYNGPTDGMFEGTRIKVYGTIVDTDSSGENMFGNEVTVPLIVGDLVVEALL